MTILYFILALGILVLIHEWGHFIVARKSGIRVEEFSIGFGPKLFGFKPGPTEYKVCLLPLGGYVKLYGENPEAEAEGDKEKEKEIAAAPDAFTNSSVKARLATVMAGPIMNIILCLILMPVVFMLGRSYPAIVEEPPVLLGVQEESPAAKAGFEKGDKILSINNEEMKIWLDVRDWILLNPEAKANIEILRGGQKQKLSLTLGYHPKDENKEIGYAGFEPEFFWGRDPIVDEVTEKSPAERAGFKSRDVIQSVNGTPIETWGEFVEKVQNSGGKPVTIEFKRDGDIQKVELTPELNEEYTKKFNRPIYIIGVTQYQEKVMKKFGFLEAGQQGMKELKRLFFLTGNVLVKLVQGDLSYKTLGGPFRIAEAAGKAARTGLAEFIYLLSFLSMQLGLINLLPIPVLDGGHVLFMAIEGITRRPLPIKLKNALTLAGVFMLFTLMILITINDIDRMWGWSDLFNSVKSIFS